MTLAVLMCKWQEAVVRTFLGLGCAVTLVLDEFDCSAAKPDPELLSQCAAVYHVSSFDAHEQLAGVAGDLLTRGFRPDLVFPHTEFSQLGAGYIELLLDGKRTPAQHVALRDKRLMKDAVASRGVPVTRWRSLTDPRDAAGADRIRSEFTFPVVVKPAFGVGTMSTYRVESPDDLGAVLGTLRYEPLLRSRQLIVEEFVPGRELHVDALWIGGEARFFLVSAYHETRLSIATGTGHKNARLDGSYIIPRAEAPCLYQAIAALHQSVNAALGITNAVTHTEFFERPDGALVFSEAAGRLGGGWIPLVLREYLGEDPWVTVARSLVTRETPAWSSPASYLGGLNLRPVNSGRIVAMPDRDSVLSSPCVRAYQPISWVGRSVAERFAAEWTAIAVLEAATEDEYLAAATQLVASHPVIVE
jgi:hypothetical protein